MLDRKIKNLVSKDKGKQDLRPYGSDEVRAINDRRQFDNSAGQGLKTLQLCLGLAPHYEAEETSTRIRERFSRCQCDLPCQYKDRCQRRYQSDWQDVVFVAIDTEGCSVRQFGIALFDTRKLEDPNLPSLFEDLSKAIETYNYDVIDDLEPEKKKPFLFGDSRRIYTREIKGILDKVLKTGSLAKEITGPRNVVLLGHSIENELLPLQNLHTNRFLIEEYPNIPILDTFKISRFIYGFKHFKCGLSDLLELLDIDSSYHHVAGNDANFTLKVTLMLAFVGCKYVKRHSGEPWTGIQLTEETKTRRETLRRISVVENPKIEVQGRSGEWLENRRLEGERLRIERLNLKNASVEEVLLDEDAMGMLWEE